MEFLVSAIKLTLRVAVHTLFFPFTHVCFPIFRFFYGIVNHLFLIPVFLIFRTALYGFIYLPLLPILHAANVKYDTLVPVEVSLYRLAIGFLPHLQVLLYHSVHFFMVSLFVGSFVGMVAGFNISLVARILYLPEKKSNNKTTKRSNDSLNTYSDWKRVKREPYSASISPDTHTTRLSTDDGTISQKTPDITTVKPEKPFFSLPQMPDAGDFSSEAIFEDDDGYNFMTYKISDERHSQTKRESFAKKRESRQRSIPPSLQMTIEEESESEITPTPTHATTAVTPTNSVSLDYATGTIGSSKTYSTDSSVFSKKIGVSRSEAKDETLQDSPEDDTELSAEEIDNKVQNRSKSGPSEKSRVPHVHTQELPNLEETVNPEVGGKEGQNPSHKDCPASNKKAEK